MLKIKIINAFYYKVIYISDTPSIHTIYNTILKYMIPTPKFILRIIIFETIIKSTNGWKKRHFISFKPFIC